MPDLTLASETIAAVILVLTAFAIAQEHYDMLKRFDKWMARSAKEPKERRGKAIYDD